MAKLKVKLLAAAFGLALASPALATGLFPGLPIDGGASYCGGYSGYNTGTTTPGVLPTPNQCNVTVPAGSANPTGTEYLPADSFGLNQATPDAGIAPATQGIAASALGFGPSVISTATGAKTIPNNSPNYIVDVSETAASALTLPASPQPWQIQRIAVVVATGASGTVTLTANSNQTMVPSSITVAGNTATGWAALLWNPTNSTWYRIQ